MNIVNKVFSFFAFFQLALILLFFIFFIQTTNYVFFILIIIMLYLLPAMLLRIFNLIRPIEQNNSIFSLKTYSPWWISHQLQSLYTHVPWIENLLKLFPGLYSFWLRLWGSTIGKNVYWTPGCIVYDRNLIEVGDNVVFGEKSILVSHVIGPRKNELSIFVKKIVIKKNSFIGAKCHIAAGNILPEGSFLKVKTDLHPHFEISND
jgi:acetyltransferase-like isoleucine patch superfamily enzyme